LVEAPAVDFVAEVDVLVPDDPERAGLELEVDVWVWLVVVRLGAVVEEPVGAGTALVRVPRPTRSSTNCALAVRSVLALADEPPPLVDDEPELFGVEVPLCAAASWSWAASRFSCA
jgi:hypothetical protein